MATNGMSSSDDNRTPPRRRRRRKRRRDDGYNAGADTEVKADKPLFSTFVTEIDHNAVEEAIEETNKNEVVSLVMQRLAAKVFEGGITISLAHKGSTLAGRKTSGTSKLISENEYRPFLINLFEQFQQIGFAVVDHTRSKYDPRRLVPHIASYRQWFADIITVPYRQRIYAVYIDQGIANLLGSEYIRRNRAPNGEVFYGNSFVYEFDPPGEDGSLRGKLALTLGQIRNLNESWEILRRVMHGLARPRMIVEQPGPKANTASAVAPMQKSFFADDELHIQDVDKQRSRHTEMHDQLVRQMVRATDLVGAANKTGEGLMGAGRRSDRKKSSTTGPLGEFEAKLGLASVLDLPQGMQVAHTQPTCSTVDNFQDHIANMVKMIVGILGVPPQVLHIDSAQSYASNAELAITQYNDYIANMQEKLTPILRQVFTDLYAAEIDKYVASQVLHFITDNPSAEVSQANIETVRESVTVEIEFNSAPLRNYADLIALRDDAILTHEKVGELILKSLHLPTEDLVKDGEQVMKKRLDQGLDLRNAAAKNQQDQSKPKTKSKAKSTSSTKK